MFGPNGYNYPAPGFYFPPVVPGLGWGGGICGYNVNCKAGDMYSFNGSNGHSGGHGQEEGETSVFGYIGRFLWPATIIGGVGALAYAGLRNHQANEVKKGFSIIRKELDGVLEQGKSADPEAVKRAYDRASQIIADKHQHLRRYPFVRWNSTMNDATFNSLSAHSEAIGSIQRALHNQPKNRVALSKLLDRLHEGMRDELAMETIGRKLHMMDSHIRSLPSGSPEWAKFQAQRRELASALQGISPSKSFSRSPEQDLAHRYITNTMDLLHAGQFLPKIGQGEVKKALQHVYGQRLATIASSTPHDSHFWESLGVSDGHEIGNRISHAQNLSWRMQHMEMGPGEKRSLAKERRQTVNDLMHVLQHRALPEIYESMSYRGSEFVDARRSASRLGNLRIRRSSRYNEAAFGNPA